MAFHSAYQSNSNLSDIQSNSILPINHLFSSDGLILGITYPRSTGELTNLPNSSSFIGYQSESDSSCTIIWRWATYSKYSYSFSKRSALLHLIL